MSQSDDRPIGRDSLDSLARRGEMDERTRTFDWSGTPVGPVSGWPQSLRTAVRIMLDSRYAMWLGWGPDFTFFYNDAYARMTLGPKHPWALGRPAREVWSEIWDDIGPRAESVIRTGRATWDEGLLLFLERRGFPEETYHTFSYSPVPDDRGGVGGMLCVVTEDTARTIGERRLRTLRELAARTMEEAGSAEDACQTAARTLAENSHDIPFALIYLLDDDGRAARLAGATGLPGGSPAAPAIVELAGDVVPAVGWPLRAVQESGRAEVVDGLDRRFGPLRCAPWPEPTRQAVAVPMAKPGQVRPTGFVVAGVSPRLVLDDGYKGFLDLLAGHVATAVASARAYEEERRRAEALAELDRAKTAFFSNVSHEFRTPLTLMLGPLEDLLEGGEELSPAAREQLEVVDRNGVRLLRLVNSLLDFSRIEAGRVRAVYRPTDLAAFTAELASVFRSACERAGLRLVVDCPPLSRPAYVDRDMWEKVVLNLLSNAFKFTFEGEVAVTMREAGDVAELRVSDTGTGIPAEEMPRLFERFHRVEGARGRTHEGSGIGLALVQELVKRHGGSIAAGSELGRGTTFVISIPLGSAHLPREQIGEGRETAPAGRAGAGVFVEEALRWLPEGGPPFGVGPVPAADPELPLVSHREPGEDGQDDRPRVLVADDNADMRRYIVRLLADGYRTEAVPDGEAALASARARPPDLILTDVMMPRLDGFGLLRRLRADSATAGVPIIMLSARAGEESRIEGMEAGADDYMVKPFGARELLARVSAHIQMARLRREAGESLRRSEERLRMALTAARMVAWEWHPLEDRIVLSENAGEVLGLSGMPSLERGLARAHPDDVGRLRATLARAREVGDSFQTQFRVSRPDNGAMVWLEVRGHGGRDGSGRVSRIAGVLVDITARKEAEDALRESEERFRLFMDHSPTTAFVKDGDGRYVYVNRLVEDQFERPLAGWIGKTDFEIFPPEEAEQLRRNDRAVLDSGETAQFFEVSTRPDGLHHYLSFKFPIRDRDGRRLLAGMAIDITERKRAEERERRLMEEAATANAQFRAFFEQGALFAGIMQVDGTIVEPNRLSLDACGYTRDQVVGKPFWECPWWNRSPALMEEIRAACARAAAGETFRAEMPYYVADGTIRVVDLIILPVKDEAGRVMFLAPTGTDITDRKRAEEETRRRSEQLRHLAEVATRLNAAVDVASVAGIVTEEARALIGSHEAVTGFTIDQNWGQAISAVSLSEKYARWRSFAEKPDGSGIYSMVCRMNRPIRLTQVELEAHPAFEWFSRHGSDHPPMRGWLAAPLVGRDGGNLGLIQLSDKYDGDFTAEDEAILVQLAQMASVAIENARLVENLRDADRRKDEFLATLAHELRNPLAPIRNGLHVMKLAEGDPESLEQSRAMMERQVTQLVRLVDDLLDLSRITRGKIELRRERVELAGVVRNSVETSIPLIEAGGHELLVDVPREPVVVDADPARLAQVVSNLLNNAARYTEPGGRITLSVGREGGEAVVIVRDTGVGIPARMIPRVFEMFTQVDGSLERSQGGLGIGLTLVKRLIEMHGGSVEARSEGPGKGSEFVVRLPAAPAPAVPRAEDDGAVAPIQRRRILVVDDNRDGAISLAMMLGLMGNETRTAHDGLEALDVAEEFRPEVILLDLGMPRLNGYDAARRIRQEPWGRGTVLVALTGWGQDEDRRRSHQAGFDLHMVKPVDPAALESVLAELKTAKA